MNAVLVASAEPEAVRVIKECLSRRYRVAVSADLGSGLKNFRAHRFELTFVDLNLFNTRPGSLSVADIKRALMPFWETSPDAEIIVLAPPHRLREAVAAVKAGASDYLSLPLSAEEVVQVPDGLP